MLHKNDKHSLVGWSVVLESIHQLEGGLLVQEDRLCSLHLMFVVSIELFQLHHPHLHMEQVLTQNVPSENVLTEDRLRDMSLAAIRELYSSMHLSDVIILCVLKKSAYDLLNVIIHSILERKVGHVCSVPGE